MPVPVQESVSLSITTTKKDDQKHGRPPDQQRIKATKCEESSSQADISEVDHLAEYTSAGSESDNAKHESIKASSPPQSEGKSHSSKATEVFESNEAVIA